MDLEKLIREHGLDRSKNYLWVVDEKGESHFLPFPVIAEPRSWKTQEMYIVFPSEGVIIPFDEEKVMELFGIHKTTVARERMKQILDDPEQLTIAINGIEQWLESKNYSKCPFNHVGWRGGCWLCAYYFEKGNGCPCAIYGIEAVKEKARVILQNLKEMGI